MITNNQPLRIKVGIVGPCTAGKSTLIAILGDIPQIELRHIAQEHSYVQNMWKRVSQPNLLIFLDVSYHVSLQRKHLDWTIDEYHEQQRRLANARENADFYLQTDNLTPDQVADVVKDFLNRVGLKH